MPEKPTAIAFDKLVPVRQAKAPGVRRGKGSPAPELAEVFAALPRKTHEATETIRRGTCPTHHQPSTDYAGVNSAGWVFRCAGYSAKTFLPDPTKRHYFTNEPAEAQA